MIFGELAGFLLVSGIMGFYIGQREAAIAAANASGRTNSGNGIATTASGGGFSGAGAPDAASDAKVKRRSGHEKMADTD